MRRWIALLVPSMIAATLLVYFSLILDLPDLRRIPLVLLGVLIVVAVGGAILTHNHPPGRRALVAVLWVFALLVILLSALLLWAVYLLGRGMH